MRSGHRDLQAKIRHQIKNARKDSSAEIARRTEETKKRINTAVPPSRATVAEHVAPVVLSKMAMRQFREFLGK